MNLVLRIMNNYLAGDFMSVPDGTTAAGYLVPESPVGSPSNGNNGGQNQNDGSDIDAGPQNPSNNNGGDNGGNDNGGNDNGGDNGGGDNGGGNDQPQVTVPPLPSTEVDPVDDVLTLAQAIVQCTLDGLSELLNPKAWNACIKGYTT